ALLLIAVPVMAQQAEKEGIKEYQQGKIDGEKDAEGQILWFGAGCLLGVVGILIAYLVPPSVPGDRLIGKSPEYVQGYTEGYQKKSREKNALWATSGCLTLTAFYLVYFLLIAASAEYQYQY
ncbi:MAG: hypothetical protein ACPL0F_07990, partial [bacterium]